MSITKILILIAAITAISGKPIDSNIDTDQLGAQVSYRDELLDTLSRLKLIAPEDDELPSPKADTTNTQYGNQQKLRQARCADNGPHSEMSYTSFRNLLNEPRFPNGDVVDFTKINMEVLKWIREHLIVELMNRALKSAAKNGN
ncbi:unnamed protein product [Macrosiphum euphorbiae]|nr:unnamed protein product [Macrosiphum euphorbiae]